jgi:acetoin utilization protein AcuB
MFVKQWMSKEVITAAIDNTLAETVKLMEDNKIRRLPVVNEDNQLVGILSREDIKNALPSLIDGSLNEATRALANQAKVSAFMTKAPVVVTPEDPLEAAAMAMQKFKIGGIPVVKDNQLLGIVTESDIFKALIEILGSSEEGIRIELVIDRTAEAFYDCLEVFKQYDAEINALSLCNDFSKDKQLLTLRWKCDYTEEVINGLWDLGLQITSILDNEDTL